MNGPRRRPAAFDQGAPAPVIPGEGGGGFVAAKVESLPPAPARPRAAKRSRSGGSAVRDGRESTGARHGLAAQDPLEALRLDVIRLDRELIVLLATRVALAVDILDERERLGLLPLDPAGEAEAARRAATVAREIGVDPELARDVFWRLMAQARTIRHRRKFDHRCVSEVAP